LRLHSIGQGVGEFDELADKAVDGHSALPSALAMAALHSRQISSASFSH
jgi:hypothetical protein